MTMQRFHQTCRQQFSGSYPDRAASVVRRSLILFFLPSDSHSLLGFMMVNLVQVAVASTFDKDFQ